MNSGMAQANEGAIYATADRVTAARIVRLQYRAKCAACETAIDPGELALGVHPEQPGNETGKWMLFHVDCIGETVFEPVSNAELFARPREAAE